MVAAPRSRERESPLSTPARFTWKRGSCLLLALVTAFVLVASVGCAPEVGSDAWCEKMKETPKGDWSANDASDYAKHCLLG
jgi:hypothetical protein